MNIWTGLLFLDGAVADPRLARELAEPLATRGGASQSADADRRDATRHAAEAARACGNVALCPPTGAALR